MNTMNISKIIGCTTLLLSLTFAAQAQTTPETGSFGIRASVGGQTAVEVPYMLNGSFSIAPYLGLNAVENANTNFSFGVIPRYYMGGNEDVSTYVTGMLGFQNTSFSNTNNSVFDVDLGIGYGAEFFFNPSFSLSGDINLNGRFGDSSNSLGTSARVAVSYYF